MEEPLPAGLSKWQIAEFIENSEVLACEIIADSALPTGACFDFQTIDKINGIEEVAS